MANLLVVDDSRLTRRIISGALENAGHTVTQAADGAEGLEAFRLGDFDCVMSDLLMPVMDGFEMTAAIRQIDAEVPILVATADIQDSSHERCRENGVTRLLNKPLKAHEITEAVDEAIAAASTKAGV